MRLLTPRKNFQILEYLDGSAVLFSYEKPIAARRADQTYIVTDRPMSDSDKRKIAQWVGKFDYAVVAHEEIKEVLSERPWFDPQRD